MFFFQFKIHLQNVLDILALMQLHMVDVCFQWYLISDYPPLPRILTHD